MGAHQRPAVVHRVGVGHIVKGPEEKVIVLDGSNPLYRVQMYYLAQMYLMLRVLARQVPMRFCFKRVLTKDETWEFLRPPKREGLVWKLM